jgi:peroxiredoxin Q/BCP
MKCGELVDDFELVDQHGAAVKLSGELANGPVVIFFFPRAFTRGCTQESCHFRDLSAEFAALGSRCLGISTDPVERQARFATSNSFDFPLLSDPDRSVAKAFGVARVRPLFNRRSTFVIGTDHRALAVIHDEMNMNKHADEALRVLRGLSDGQR